MNTAASIRIQTALLSVSDKIGIIEFAHALAQLQITLLSTGGTAKLLQANGIAVIEIAEYTGFPEMMAGRVKTLHPKIHGGLLGRRGIDDAIMQEHEIEPIDLLVVNLYPFAQTIAQPDCDLTTAIENIDIGGPAMLRSAAKNHAAVGVVVDHTDYAAILDELRQNTGQLSYQTRFKLAGKAFAHTAQYDSTIAAFLNATDQTTFPENFIANFRKIEDLRYGENPHQAAAFYRAAEPQSGCIASAQQQQGKALSFNNIADGDAALECVKSFTEPTCVIVKHANPCGIASADTLLEAYQRAYATDPTSAFGGIIALNRPLDETTATAILQQQFVEVIIAPEASTAASQVIATKPNIRLLTTGSWQQQSTELDYKKVTGGLLVQQADTASITAAELKTVSDMAPDAAQLADLLFAWRAVKFVKSNAIVYAKNQQTLGIGAGQMSRVYSAKIAALKAQDVGLELKGAVMASDAFLPFRDGVDTAAAAGISAIIQPGGSKRDAEVIAAANEHGIAMVFTGMRHFRH